MPKQSARLVLVNDVNFMLYTPFLPEAAAGTLEPRHVVTPLRDILKRTYLRLGAIVGHDPAARTVELRDHEGETEQLPYDQLLLALGSVSRVLPVPGPRRARDRLQEPRRRDLAAQPRDRDARGGERDRGPGAGATSCSPTSSSAAATPASRRWPSCRTSPPTRWSATRAPACTGCAGSWSRRPTGCCRRSTPSSPTTRCASCAAAASTSASGRRWRRSTADSARLSTGETLPTRTVVWTAGVAPHPSLRAAHAAARRARPGPGRRPPAGRGHGLGLGDRRLRRRRPTRAAAPARRPPSTRSARARSRRATSPPSSGSASPSPSTTAASAAFVNLGRYKAVGQIGDRTFRGFPAWWMARTYHMSQIPGAARKVRAVLDWTASLPFRRDIAEVGSIGHPKRARLAVYPTTRSCACPFRRGWGGCTRAGRCRRAGRSCAIVAARSDVRR